MYSSNACWAESWRSLPSLAKLEHKSPSTSVTRSSVCLTRVCLWHETTKSMFLLIISRCTCDSSFHRKNVNNYNIVGIIKNHSAVNPNLWYWHCVVPKWHRFYIFLRPLSITSTASDNICMAVSDLSGIIMCWYAVKKLLTSSFISRGHDRSGIFSGSPTWLVSYIWHNALW